MTDPLSIIRRHVCPSRHGLVRSDATLAELGLDPLAIHYDLPLAIEEATNRYPDEYEIEAWRLVSDVVRSVGHG